MNKKLTARVTKSIDGNHAVAEAFRQVNPDVFGFYPITPTSYIGEVFAKSVANGDVDTEYVCAESEHAAMSICVGAAAAGGRAVSATASQGLVSPLAPLSYLFGLSGHFVYSFSLGVNHFGL